MTDITDQDLCKALAWAEGSMARGGADSAARVILATVDAPALTLAERLEYRADLLDNGDPDGDTPQELRDLADRAAQMEHDLTEVREALAVEGRRVEKIAQERDHFFREVEDVRNWKERLINERDEARAEVERARAEVERLTAKVEDRKWEVQKYRDRCANQRKELDLLKRADMELRAEVERLTAERVTDPSPTLNDGSMTRHATVAREENVSHDLPEPADVKPGEAWIVNIDGVEIVPGFKSSVGWICYRLFSGTTKAIGDERITLVSRLVPAPRVITNPDEAWNLPISAIIRDSRGETFERTEDGWGRISVPVKAIKWPVTVLWEPEA